MYSACYVPPPPYARACDATTPPAQALVRSSVRPAAFPPLQPPPPPALLPGRGRCSYARPRAHTAGTAARTLQRRHTTIPTRSPSSMSTARQRTGRTAGPAVVARSACAHTREHETAREALTDAERAHARTRLTHARARFARWDCPFPGPMNYGPDSPAIWLPEEDILDDPTLVRKVWPVFRPPCLDKCGAKKAPGGCQLRDRK